MLIQLLLNGFILGSIYSLMSLGYALIYNTTKTFHIAYATIYALCPYFFLSFYRFNEMNFILSLLLALVLSILVSIAMEVLVYKPLVKKKSSPNIFTISSIGVMIIIINLIALFYGNETKILNPGISPSLSMGNVIITYTQLYQLVSSTLLLVGFMVILKKTNFGIVTRAMSNNNLLCSILGLNIPRFRIFLFAISGFLAAISGFLIAYDVGMDPYVGMPMFLNAVVALIMGGVGSFKGPILGGYILGMLQSMAVWLISSRWQNAVTFILLIIFLLARPQGIFGEKERVV